MSEGRKSVVCKASGSRDLASVAMYVYMQLDRGR